MSADNDTPERDEKVAKLLRAAASSERAPDALRARIAAMRDESAGLRDESAGLRDQSAGLRRGRAGAASPRRRGWLGRPAFNFAQFALPTTAAAVAALVLVLGSSAG
ncbi:MAG: hypothetical protein KGL16_13505, partial [Acidobacteriota bacterium]|nr:hypothetical protein [Acidobacteriota bacterium]